jgi:hypothetical protein
MSKNTVKSALTRNRRKRAKRAVENSQFAAFTRRILTAYARRVATGDVEALADLTRLVADVDTAVNVAVTGLRSFGYSWAEIAHRLGISRQAAQQRWGNPAERGRLDQRLLAAGVAITLDTLVQVFADHCRGIPAASVCPGCDYRFDPDDTGGDCPTNQVVRPLLLRRKAERPTALKALTSSQLDQLLAKPKPHSRNKSLADSTATTATTGDLFDPTPLKTVRKAGLR